MLLGRLRPAEEHARTAVALASEGETGASLARALANLACISAIRGNWEAASPAIERALGLEDVPGLASIDDSPSAVAGLLLMYRGELDAARERLQYSLAQTHALGGDSLSTGLLFALSEIETRAGRFREAHALALRGLTASEQTGQSTERTVLLYAKALAEAHLGEADACRESAAEGLRIAEAAEHRFAACQNRWALGHLELACGRADEAWVALEPAVAQLRESEVGELGLVPVHPEAIEALVMLGETERASALVEELSDVARWPWLSAAALRCRGLLRAAEGDTGAALRHLVGAVEQHRALAPRSPSRAPCSRWAARSAARRSEARRGRHSRRPRRRSPRWARSGGPSGPAGRRGGLRAAARAAATS